MRKLTLISITTALSVASFIISLSFFAILSGQNQETKELISILEKSKKITAFHNEISFERAFNILSNHGNFALYDKDCKPILVKDLRFNKKSCEAMETKYIWTKLRIGEQDYNLVETRNFRLIDYILNFSELFKVSVLSFMIFSSLLAFIFYKIFITKPTSLIANKIDTFLRDDGKFEISFPTEKGLVYNDLYKVLNTLISKISDYQGKIGRAEISRQIAHDLRSPVAILKEQINSSFLQESKTMLKAVKRIQQISDSLVERIKDSEEINLIDTISEIEDLAHYYKLSLKLKRDQRFLSKLKSKVSDQDLYRFLSNIIKNSKEAHANNICVSFNTHEHVLIISLEDDGEGISMESLETLKTKTFTNKKNGNGLGLSYIKKTLVRDGGKLEIYNISPKGFGVRLSIPLLSALEPITRIVLIDDDKYIGLSWMQSATRLNIPFLYIPNYSDLILKMDKLSQDDSIFIDLNIGDTSGLLVAEELHKIGFKKLYLASGTNLPKSDIPTIVLNTFGKEFPVI